MNRRLFLLGAGATLASAASAELIVPGLAMPLKAAHMVLPDDPLAERREIWRMGADVDSDQPNADSWGCIRIGRLGGAEPLMEMEFPPRGGFYWEAIPGAALILNRARPLLWIEVQGLADAGRLTFKVNYTDHFEWESRRSSRQGFQKFEFPAGKCVEANMVWRSPRP